MAAIPSPGRQVPFTDTGRGRPRHDGLLLVDMPFASTDRPGMGISVLRAAMAAAGIPCRVAYFNLTFAEYTGPRLYDALSNTWSNDLTLLGEWLFSQHFYGRDDTATEEYLTTILAPVVPPEAIPQVLWVREIVPDFLERCYRSVDWDDWLAVGFTSMFDQNMAALALARMVKQRHPDVHVMFGGANCESVMGVEIARRYPFVDAVCTGEGDQVVPRAMQSLRSGGTVFGIPGFASRSPATGEVVDHGPPDVVRRMDDVPAPDFDDYFAALSASPVGHYVAPWLQMEASRGCWWGAVSHCTFCGLNDRTLGFRAKSRERVRSELAGLVGRYRLPRVSFVDNILERGATDGFLSDLAGGPPGLQMFFEVKSNLRPKHVKKLAAAGVTHVQPGIESFSTPMLRLMRKGVTALQNVSFLKSCALYGVSPQWNLLYGFPGEDPAEYPAQLEVLRSITHLAPPGAIAPIRLDRFSPNFVASAAMGYTNVRPAKSYRYVYPFDDDVLGRLCYRFDFDYADGRDPDAYTAAVVEFCRDWVAHQPAGDLVVEGEPGGGAVITDTRYNRRVDRLRLDPRQHAVYRACAEPRSLSAILRTVDDAVTPPVQPEQLNAFLRYLRDRLLVVNEGESWLALALPREELHPEPAMGGRR